MVLVSSAALAEALAIDLDETGMRAQDLAGYHGRSPDQTLDIFKGLLIADRIEDGAAIVIGFPPRPGSFGVVTMEDVRWRMGERRRRLGAQTRGLLPRRVRSLVQSTPEAPLAMREAVIGDDDDPNIEDSQPVEQEQVKRSRWPRVRPRALRGRSTDTWDAPSQTKQYGLPRTHGVQLHRTVSTDRGEAGWRNALPRTPVAAPVLALLLFAVLAVLVYGIWSLRPESEGQPADYAGALSQVDQYILAVGESSNPDDTRQTLELAQTALDVARQEGASPEELAPRQAAITETLDEIDNVIRVSNLTRVGTLPEELQSGGTSAQLTGSGLFLVNGGLYQIRTDERQIIPILEEGETTADVDVGDLYGIAMDATGLHVTDGQYVFTLQPDGSWVPVELGDINNLGRWNPGPVGAFGGSIYILETEYRNIYRFDTETQGVAEPSDWVLASVRPNLVSAVDMAIDRNIHVLLDNVTSPDEVLIYSQGDLADRYQIPYAEGSEPTAILIGPATQYLYIAVQNGREGAVIVFDTASGDAWQLRVPAGFSVSDADVAAPFEGLQDIAIDEDSGTLYIVNGDGVWTAQYQLPVDTSGTPTPQPVEETGG